MTNWKKIYTDTTLDQYIPEDHNDDSSYAYTLYRNHTTLIKQVNHANLDSFLMRNGGVSFFPPRFFPHSLQHNAYTTPFNLKDITSDSGTIRCRCTKQIPLARGILKVICPQCYRKYSVDGFKCPKCNSISLKLFKLIEQPTYYVCSKCTYATPNELIQTKDMCEVIIKKISRANLISKI